MNIPAKIWMGIIALALSPFFVQAQMPDPVTFSVTDAPEKVKAGAQFELTVDAQIEGEWHLYSVNIDPDAGPFPTRFTAANNQIIIADSVRESEPVVEYDPNFKVDLGWHSKQATFTVPIAFLKGASGSSKVALEVNYQVCTDKVCLPPETKNITQQIEVTGVADNPVQGFDSSRSEEQSSSGASVDDAQPSATVQDASTSSLGGNGIFSFIWLALSAGFAALITPCVYPMIPLTVSYFSKNSKGESKSTVGSAFTFGIAIIGVFTFLGILLSLLIGASGANQFAANPWVNLSIAAILIVFAFSLLGAFEIRLPHQLTNWLNQKSNESTGIAGILFMALTISAVSFACTMPFVSGLLAASSQGEWFFPIIGMIFFSAAFASPFVILAIFPKWMESMPQSGSWMNIVKVLLGFIELAAAIKFLSNADLVWEWGLISRPFAIAAWIAISLLAGLYMLGVFVMHHETKPKTIGTGRLMIAMPFLLFIFYLIPGLLGASLGIWDAWLPPKQATDISVVQSISQRGDTQEAESLEKWSEDYKASLEQAVSNQQPVFIDFTGYTCTNCRAMEANVFPVAAVQNLFDQMELVRLYTDDGTDGSENQKFQFKLTGTVALPTYVIVNPETQKVITQLEGYTELETFKNFLNEGLTNFYQKNSAI